MTSDGEFSKGIRQLMERGKGIIKQQNENVAKLNELKDKLDSIKDFDKFAGMRQEILQIKARRKVGLSN